jgi:hypothetical protein
VCDLQAKVKRFNNENQEVSSQLRVYKETQVTLNQINFTFFERHDYHDIITSFVF